MEATPSIRDQFVAVLETFDAIEANCTATLIASVREAKRKADVIPLYKENLGNPAVDWSAFNHAIIERWSISALRDIKNGAWKQWRSE